MTTSDSTTFFNVFSPLSELSELESDLEDDLEDDFEDDFEDDLHEDDLEDELESGLQSGLPDFGVIGTSPVRGKTRKERAEARRRKGLKKKRQEAERNLLEAEQTEHLRYEDVIAYLQSRNIRFGDLLNYIFDPSNGKGSLHYHQFLARPGTASRILDWWVSSEYSAPVRAELREWTMDYVAKSMSQEARKATESRQLQTLGKAIDQDLVTSFSYAALHDELKTKLAPMTGA